MSVKMAANAEAFYPYRQLREPKWYIQRVDSYQTRYRMKILISPSPRLRVYNNYRIIHLVANKLAN
jgi:hypothetical protein